MEVEPPGNGLETCPRRRDRRVCRSSSPLRRNTNKGKNGNEARVICGFQEKPKKSLPARGVWNVMFAGAAHSTVVNASDMLLFQSRIEAFRRYNMASKFHWIGVGSCKGTSMSITVYLCSSVYSYIHRT